MNIYQEIFEWNRIIFVQAYTEEKKFEISILQGIIEYSVWAKIFSMNINILMDIDTIWIWEIFQWMKWLLCRKKRKLPIVPLPIARYFFKPSSTSSSTSTIITAEYIRQRSVSSKSEPNLEDQLIHWWDHATKTSTVVPKYPEIFSFLTWKNHI